MSTEFIVINESGSYIGRKKIWDHYIEADTVYITGTYDHSEIASIDITFTCETCNRHSYNEIEFKNIKIEDEDSDVSVIGQCSRYCLTQTDTWSSDSEEEEESVVPIPVVENDLLIGFQQLFRAYPTVLLPLGADQIEDLSGPEDSDTTSQQSEDSN